MKKQQGFCFVETVGFADVNVMGPRAHEAAVKVRAILERIDLSDFPLKIELGVHAPWEHNSYRVDVFANLAVTDQDTKELAKLTVRRTLLEYQLGGVTSGSLEEVFVLAQARSACHGVLAHELDEHFKVDGKLPFDPYEKKA